MRFINPNLGNNSTHESQLGLMIFMTPSSWTYGRLKVEVILSNTTHTTLPCYANKVLSNDVHDGQHEPAFLLDSWLKPVVVISTAGSCLFLTHYYSLGACRTCLGRAWVVFVDQITERTDLCVITKTIRVHKGLVLRLHAAHSWSSTRCRSWRWHRQMTAL